MPDEKTEDVLAAAHKSFERHRDWWDHNQSAAKDDLRFARLGEQWDSDDAKTRKEDRRPCMTFNKMPSFIRQVVNDARQNKPAIKVHPQDSKADPAVAEIYNGLIRNIETLSDADVAYDTAIEQAVTTGFGFWQINTEYTHDDTFEQDIVIERVPNQFTVFPDPDGQRADSSDWNSAWVVSTMRQDDFERDYPDAEKVNWDFDFKDCPDGLGVEDGNVVIATWWTREPTTREIVALSDGSVMDVEEVAEQAETLQAAEIMVVGDPRPVQSWKVRQRILTGAEVLEDREWAGKYIPIVPVWGDEVIDEQGKRHYRSLIRDAKGSQAMYNYMRSTAVEMLALQPRVPWVAEEGAFDVDPNWDVANSESISKLEYKKGSRPPERQPLPQSATAAIQEALAANDDMKSIIGIYDASLGAKSNETSGKAILARQREGDVSTFHFIDNLSRAIRHGGRIIMDLIPKVYSTERIVRVLGEDNSVDTARIAPTGQPVSEQPDPRTMAMVKVYDLTVGKYDLTVSAGPNYTTRREEIRETMTQLAAQGSDEIGAVLAPYIAKMLDLPFAEEISKKLEALAPGAEQGQLPPEIQAQMQQGMALIQQLQQENAALKQQLGNKQGELAVKMQKNQIDARKMSIDATRAQAEYNQSVAPPF